ncbi:hypothetical protein [Kurthia sp. Dielmo]|uniref:hypothetical protein n=1 Tax=Kurthia sp. Dielmo TaxID=1033738 RepID=UPI001120F1F8|nr:hypothetical protein [Kurthia sp. Dielmo]
MTQEKRNKRKTYLKELDEVRASKSEDFEANFNTFFDSLAVDDVKLETMIDISEAKSLEWNGSRDVSLTMSGIGISMLISFVLASGDSLYSFHVLISGLLTGVFAFLFFYSANERDSYANLAIELKDRYKEKCLSDSKGTLSFAEIKQAIDAKETALAKALAEAEAKVAEAEAKVAEAEAKAELNNSN